MYTGMLISNLIAAVERAERRVAALEAKEMAVIEIPAALLWDYSCADELVVA